MKKLLFAIFVICALGLAYSLFYEPYTLEIKNYTIKNERLAGIKIVFASDFHIGKKHKELRRLDKIIEAINKENADIVVLGGDYVKGHNKSASLPIEEISFELRKIKSNFGIYAVLGNHDGYYGQKKIKTALETNKIKVLHNNFTIVKTPKTPLIIAGVADYYTDFPDLNRALPQKKVLPTLLISHSPDIFPQNPQADLILAGHTHGGQVIIPYIGPILVPSDYGRKYAQGLFNENSRIMIVSKGLGTSLLPIRFNCKPEIVIIEFEA